MINFENTKIVGWEPSIRGVKNSSNSLDESDSEFDVNCDICDSAYHDCNNCPTRLYSTDGRVGALLGPNDLDLMTCIIEENSPAASYLQLIVVYVDITAPLYWWTEFDTYKVSTITDYHSTMRRIQEKKFTLEDFSHEHLLGEGCVSDHDYQNPHDILNLTIESLNFYRQKFLDTASEIKQCPLKDFEKRKELVDLKKRYWQQIIQLLPSSYNQRRTIMLNYEILAKIYQRWRSHKLDECQEFCCWIEGLPYSKLITCDIEDEL